MIKSSGAFLLVFALAAACLLLGSFPILAAVGLLETEGSIEPLGRVVAFLFGTVFVGFGIGLVALPVRSFARARGVHTVREIAALARRQLVQRIDSRSVLAAFGVGVLGLAYWLSTAGMQLPLVDADTLVAIIVLEFLVVNGFPFLVLGLSFLRGGGVIRFIAVVILAVVLTNLGVLSWVYGGGLEGLAWLLYLLLPNAIAFVGTTPERGVRALALTRWVIKFSVFMVMAGTVGDGSLEGPNALSLGAAYFTVLAAIELFRGFEIPIDLAHALGDGDQALGVRS